MNKFEKLLIELRLSNHNYLEDLKSLKKHITSVMKDYENMNDKEFRIAYPRCEYTYEGLCYYRRLVTRKIRIVKELYND